MQVLMLQGFRANFVDSGGLILLTVILEFLRKVCHRILLKILSESCLNVVILLLWVFGKTGNGLTWTGRPRNPLEGDW